MYFEALEALLENTGNNWTKLMSSDLAWRHAVARHNSQFGQNGAALTSMPNFEFFKSDYY